MTKRGYNEVIDLTSLSEDEECHEISVTDYQDIKPAEKSKRLKRNDIVSLSSATNPPVSSEDVKECFIDIFRQDGDDGILSRGITLPTSSDKLLFCTTSESVLEHTSKTLMTDQKNSSSYLVHIQQRDQWSCGFRNLQMIFSSLLPHLCQAHPCWTYIQQDKYDVIQMNSRLNLLPSVLQLQHLIELSWKEGFDSDGKQHFSGKIIKKKSRIGAVEVASVSSFVYLDTTLVQFIACQESRSLLGPFLWIYFKQGRLGFTNNHCDTKELANKILSLIGENTSINEKKINKSQKMVGAGTLPVYLQWEGHSVTIVGVVKNENTFNLIVFDPLKKWNWSTRKIDDLSVLELSTTEIIQKDLQIILFGEKRITEIERRERLSIKNHVVTAARDKVLQTLSIN